MKIPKKILIDLNGTLSQHGTISSADKNKIHALAAQGFELILLTGDSRGNASRLIQDLPITLQIARSSDEKENAAREHVPCIAIGNARIDIGMFEQAVLSIGVMGKEGLHSAILSHIDVMVTSFADACDQLLDENALKATSKE